MSMSDQAIEQKERDITLALDQYEVDVWKVKFKNDIFIVFAFGFWISS